MIRDNETQQSIVVYSCNILGAKTWFPETACMELVEGNPVEFEIVPGAESCGACKVTGGILDVEQWERIKGKDLAFRCDSQGNATTGLFKGGAK